MPAAVTAPNPCVGLPAASKRTVVLIPVKGRVVQHIKRLGSKAAAGRVRGSGSTLDRGDVPLA